MTTSAIPPGFSPSDLHEGFLDHVGPFFTKADPAGTFVLAFRAEARHANRYGVVHGGMLATLADVAIGANLARTGDAVETTLTTHLGMDYIAAARLGDWIEAQVTLTKERGRVRFGECALRAGDRLLARASAVFYVPPSA
jgi:uncharacterized protein (TIGR00369 family)